MTSTREQMAAVYPPMPKLPEIQPPTAKQIMQSQASKVKVDKFRIKAPRRFQVIDNQGVRHLNLKNLQQCIEFRNAMIVDHDKMKDLLPHESTMYTKFVTNMQQQGCASQPRYPSNFKYQLHLENQLLDPNLRAIKEIISKPDDFFNKTSYKQTVKTMKKQMAFFEMANPFKQKSQQVEEAKRPDIGQVFARSLSIQQLKMGRSLQTPSSDQNVLPDLDTSKISQHSGNESMAKFDVDDIMDPPSGSTGKKPRQLSKLLEKVGLDQSGLGLDDFNLARRTETKRKLFSVQDPESDTNRDHYWQTLTGKSDRNKLSKSDALISKLRFSNEDLSGRLTIREVGKPVVGVGGLPYSERSSHDPRQKMHLPKGLWESAQDFNDYYCNVEMTLNRIMKEYPEFSEPAPIPVCESPQQQHSPTIEVLRKRIEQLKSVKKGTQDYLLMLHRSDQKKETLRRSEISLTKIQEQMDNHNRRLFEKNLVIFEDDEPNEDKFDGDEGGFGPKVTFEPNDMRSDSSKTWNNYGGTTHAVLGSRKVLNHTSAWMKEGAGHGSQKRMIVKSRPLNPPPEPKPTTAALAIKRKLVHDPLRKIFHKLPYFKKGIYHSVWMEMIDELLLEENLFDGLLVEIKEPSVVELSGRPEMKRQQSTILRFEGEPSQVSAPFGMHNLEMSEVSMAVPLSDVGYYRYIHQLVLEVQASPDPFERGLAFLGQMRNRIKADLATDREKFFDNYCTLCAKFVQNNSQPKR